MKKVLIILACLLVVGWILSNMGFEPAVTAKETALAWVRSASTSALKPPKPIAEAYIVPNEWGQSAKGMILTRDRIWEGSSSRKIQYTAAKAPWVLNAGSKTTSSLGSKFDMEIWKVVSSEWAEPVITTRYGVFEQTTCYVIENTGNYVIVLTSSGCDWWVKIGVEQVPINK